MSKLLVSEPSSVCLPSLGKEEAAELDGHVGSGKIRSAVSSEAKRIFGPMWNLFGAHDIRGRGSHNSEALHCDPFILCHAGKIPKGMKPPFCAHPHCGASVASLFFQGGTISPWDNIHGTEKIALVPGGIYHVDTGAGCVHDEPFDVISLTRTRAHLKHQSGCKTD